MKLKISTWTVSRKKIRPSFSLGALGLLFSISDRVSGPNLSAQDRRDTAYPYLLELVPEGRVSGQYRLLSSDGAWTRELAGRVWRTQAGKTGTRLVTDLTEYERVLWEELAAGERAAGGRLTLEFETVE